MDLLQKIQVQFNNVNANIQLLATYIQELADENAKLKQQLKEATQQQSAEDTVVQK